MNLEKLKYPIGKFQAPDIITQSQLDKWMQDIKSFPEKMASLVQKLPDEQLALKYRPNGWSIKEVVHHTADSHMNAVIRFKWALTEEKPTIKPYLEAKWIQLNDAQSCSVDISLALLKALHHRWYSLMEGLDEDQWDRQYHHPDHASILNLKKTAGMYSWHCRHHTAHVINALDTIDAAWNKNT